jgi:hypothetical protein
MNIEGSLSNVTLLGISESGPDPRSGTGEANTWWLLESCHHDKDLQHFLLPIMVRLPQILQSLGTGIWDHIMKISNHVSMTRIYNIFCYQYW